MIKYLTTIYLTLLTWILGAPSVLAAPLGKITPNCGAGVASSSACDWDDLLDLASSLMRLAVNIAVPIAIILIVYSGALFIKGANNPSGRTQAKNVLKKTLVGFFAILGAFLLVNAILAGLGVKEEYRPENIQPSSSYFFEVALALQDLDITDAGGSNGSIGAGRDTNSFTSGRDSNNLSTGRDTNPLNPLAASDIREFLWSIVKLVYQLLIPVVGLAFIYAGLLYVTARGNENQIKRAHQAFLWTLIGASLIMGAYVLVRLIENTLIG